MKVRYYLEYISKETNKAARADLGYNAAVATSTAYIHLKKGDLNVVIVPVLEDTDIMEEDDISIIDVDVEVRLDEIPEQKEPARPN